MFSILNNCRRISNLEKNFAAFHLPDFTRSTSVRTTWPIPGVNMLLNFCEKVISQITG